MRVCVYVSLRVCACMCVRDNSMQEEQDDVITYKPDDGDDDSDGGGGGGCGGEADGTGRKCWGGGGLRGRWEGKGGDWGCRILLHWLDPLL